MCLQPGRPTVLWAALKKRDGQQGEGGDCAPLLSSCEAPSRVLHPGLWPSVQARHRALGAGPEESH